MGLRLVLAFGGNALAPEDERGTWEEQARHAATAARAVVELRAAGHEVLLTHGNGPQVGALALQQLAATNLVPPLPLDALGAMTQGQLGYLLQQALASLDSRLPSVALVTRVVVDADDPAFARPTKPIGPFYDERSARALAAARGWTVGPDAGRGFRRLVASPRPLEILEVESVRQLLARGVVVIAGGGGGVPVARAGSGLRGLEAVVDKDLCAATLAAATGADLLVLVTAVPRVALDYGTRWQRDLARLTVSEARRALDAGEFPAGSMGPKIEAGVRFVEDGGRAAIVTSLEHVAAAVAGDHGTWLVPDRDAPAVAA